MVVVFCDLKNPAAIGSLVHPEPPLAPELCDGIDNDCDSTTLDGVDECSVAEWCDSKAVDADGSLGVCRPLIPCFPDVDGDTFGNMSVSASLVGGVSCPVGFVLDNSDCDDHVTSVHPGASEVLDCRDDDCDLTVDEGFVACEDSYSSCTGTLDCKSFFDDVGVCRDGCTSISGVCDNGMLCDLDHPCMDGSVCVGIDCAGYVSCAGLGDSSCSSYHAYGCSLSVCSSTSYKSTTDASMGGVGCDALSGCEWDCGAYVNKEICSNGVDDDGDGKVDCEDDDCNGGGALSLTDAQLSQYNCLGTDQTGDVTGLSYYCGSPVGRDDIGMCCLAGDEPYYDSSFGTWVCRPSDPCYPAPPFECNYDYSTQFTEWLGDVGCVDASTTTACCNVVQFGTEDYYSNSNNIIIY